MIAELLFAQLIFRGLSYRNDGPDIADAKQNAYVRMLQRYPVDATKQITETLRPDGWLPSCDTLETEIRDLISDRLEVMNALENAEILTEKQLFDIKTRALSYDLADILACFPIYDTGKPSRLTYFEKQTQKLKLALDAYLDHDAETTDFVDKRNIAIAQKYLADGFNEDPNITETAQQREQRMKDERDHMTRQKAAMIEELKT